VVASWNDLILPLILAFGAGAIAVFWPWIQTWQRGRRFEHIIRRELQEIGPYPDHPVGQPWWMHARMRFVHEEIFARERVSENREFLLSLSPDVVYAINQLWISFDKQDGGQWLYYLRTLTNINRLQSKELSAACERWAAIMAAQREDWRDRGKVRATTSADASAVVNVPGLFDRRLERYTPLARLTRDVPVDSAGRQALSDGMITWYYEDGGGLLLSGRAVHQFFKVRDALLNAETTETVRSALSLLRTDLKIDLGVRDPAERLAEFAEPADENRF
jgi:hypothetical protein